MKKERKKRRKEKKKKKVKKKKKKRKKSPLEMYPFGCSGSQCHHNMAVRLQLMRDSLWFQWIIVAFILLAGIQSGMQLYSLPTDLVYVLTYVDIAVTFVFTLELILKVLAEGNEPWMYFLHEDGWNVLDTIIVLSSYVPYILLAVTGSSVTGDGSSSTAALATLVVLRMVRLLRLVRIVRVSLKLRTLVSGLGQSV